MLVCVCVSMDRDMRKRFETNERVFQICSKSRVTILEGRMLKRHAREHHLIASLPGPL